MGNFQDNDDYKEKRKYSNTLQNIDNKLKGLYDKIKSLEIKRNSDLENMHLIKEEIKLYKQIFKYNNTKESDIIEYLLLNYNLFQKKEIDEEKMKKKINKYNFLISDEEYNKNFYNFQKRVNSLTKIFNLLNILKTDLDNDDSDNKNENKNDDKSKKLLLKRKKEFITRIKNLEEKKI